MTSLKVDEAVSKRIAEVEAMRSFKNEIVKSNLDIINLYQSTRQIYLKVDTAIAKEQIAEIEKRVDDLLATNDKIIADYNQQSLALNDLLMGKE